MKKTLLILILLTNYAFAKKNNALDSSIAKNFTLSGYIETYYSYDFSSPANHERPNFFYNYNRHNEVNLNLGFIKANYQSERVRGNFALMTGTYAQYNLAAEQGLLKNVFEANVGIKLSKNRNLWIDAGIMPSHIGFESAIGKSCWNLTRGILAENSPYYNAGAKLNYTSNNSKWYLSLLYLNGWQRIQRIPGVQTPAFGSQITYTPNSNTILNWSTYVGNESPGKEKLWRFFNNFYAQFQATNKLGFILGFDIGSQQYNSLLADSSLSKKVAIWYTPNIITRYAITDKINLASRLEYYADNKGVIIATNTLNGFQTFGYSLNLDYNLTENLVFRIEGRGFTSKDPIFTLASKPSHQNYFVTTSIAISL